MAGYEVWVDEEGTEEELFEIDKIEVRSDKTVLFSGDKAFFTKDEIVSDVDNIHKGCWLVIINNTGDVYCMTKGLKNLATALLKESGKYKRIK
jgi:hypothetical protein